MFFFGLITMLQGFTHNLSGLIATRFFLGVVESGVGRGPVAEMLRGATRLAGASRTNDASDHCLFVVISSPHFAHAYAAVQ